LEKTSTIHALLNRNLYQNYEDDDGDDGEKGTSFGEKLRAAEDEGEGDSRSDEELKAKYTEQEGKKITNSVLWKDLQLTMSAVITGEEDDYTIHQVRSKLFSLEDGQWKERGTGLLKLNVKDSDGTGARLGLYICSICRSVSNPQPPQLCAETPFALFF